MSLRTVALDTPRPRERAIGLRPDRLRGGDVLLHDGPEDRRLALVELHWHSILPSASRDAARLLRAPARSRAATSLPRSRPRRVRTTRSPARVEETGVDRARRCTRPSREDRPPARGSLIPPRGAQRQRRRPPPARAAGSRISSPASVDVPGGDRGDVALGRAHVPPAAAGGVAVGGTADRGVVAALPSRGGCGGTRRPGGPSSRSRTRRGRRRSGGRRRPRTSSAWSSSSGAARSPGRDRLAERRARLDGRARTRSRARARARARRRGSPPSRRRARPACRR